LDERARSQDEALQTAAAAYDLAQQRYRAGIGSFLEVLSVEEQLLTARERMAALQSQQILASVKLRRALGGGFAPAPAAASAEPAATPASTHS
ncbi:TolC family protein, partial [Xanthomonas sp. Kuri4-3]